MAAVRFVNSPVDRVLAPMTVPSILPPVTSTLAAVKVPVTLPLTTVSVSVTLTDTINKLSSITNFEVNLIYA